MCARLQNPEHLEGAPEMSQLVYLETPHVVHNLDVRYQRGQIYTSMQTVLLAVNPYAEVAIYGAAARQRGFPRAHMHSVPLDAQAMST